MTVQLLSDPGFLHTITSHPITRRKHWYHIPYLSFVFIYLFLYLFRPICSR